MELGCKSHAFYEEDQANEIRERKCKVGGRLMVKADGWDQPK